MKNNWKVLVMTSVAFLLMAAGIPVQTSPVGGGDSANGIAGIHMEIKDHGTGLVYAIITNAILSGSFAPLKQWRSQTGTRASTFILDGPDGILNGFDGEDDAEKVFSFITALYEESGGTLEYILLGGDSEVVPIRYLWANASQWDYDDEYLSDVYYSSPGTDWDLDGDGRYGEREDIEGIGIENLSFPLNVGRFPVSNVVEADRMVRRTIDYERDPEEGNWTEKGIIASSLMDRPNVPNLPETPEDEGFDPYKDNAYKAFANYTLRYIPRSLDVSQVHDYQEYEGGRYNLSVDTLDDGTLPSLLNQGCSFMTFAGQSFYDIDFGNSPPLAYSLAHYRVDSGTVPGASGFGLALTYEDSYNLTNGEKLPVVYISSCDSANFSDPGDRSLENLVYAPNGGAICLIGSTGVSWRGEGENYSLGNWYLISKFWERMIGTNMPGASLYWLKQHYIDAKWDEFATKEVLLIEVYSYNLLGDPALRAWIGEPVKVLVQNSSVDHYAGGDTYSLRVTNVIGAPQAMVKVSMYMNTTGEVFTALTGPDGFAHIETSFTSGGNATVTVTGRNIIPVIKEAKVSDEPMDIELGQVLTITPLPLTEGAKATLKVDVSNIGGRTAQGIKVHVFEGKVGDDPVSWPVPLSSKTIDLNKGETETLEFLLDPSRSWTGISAGAEPPSGEINIKNNLAFIDLDVNARPRFLSLGLLEMEEDMAGGGTFDLSTKVFDPDDDELLLLYSLGTGAPEWCRIDGYVLMIGPPANWSGTFDITLRVSDGLAEDLIVVSVFVSPVNDAPSIIGLMDTYNATVDIPFTLFLRTFDVEGDALEITLISDLERLKLSGDTLRMVPYTEDEGMHPVVLNISDPMGGNRSYMFVLSISPPSGQLHFDEPSVHLPDAREGSSYNYVVKVGGDLSEDALFSDDTDLFVIGPSTGKISFTPDKEDIGEHWITISVSSGNTTIERTFLLEVSEAQEDDNTLLWILGIVIAILVAALVGLIIWSGPRPVQYGLEE